MLKIKTWFIYFNTIRYLKCSQIFWRIFKKMYSPKVSTKISFQKSSPKAPWITSIYKRSRFFIDQKVCFLNECQPISSKLWNNSTVEKLWLYNLHYFDALASEEETDREKAENLIHQWLDDNPPFYGNGWEPYPISLRVVNWIKYELSGGQLSQLAKQSIYLQVRFLRKHLEYHLLGNHLFENLKTLLFAGLFFDTAEAKKWFKFAMSKLDQQLQVQILNDGGHFELSPMYHIIVLEGLLDLYNLFSVFGQIFPNTWLEIVSKMRFWLKVMCHPDGGIAFFNDATFGIASQPKDIEEYAAKLGLGLVVSPKLGVTHLKESGYIRYQSKEMVAIIDVAALGPDYLLGHAHADTLSFECSLYGQRLIVNSGISCYGISQQRSFERSTSAHSTVEVGGENSSQVWSGFRVAQRAYPEDLQIEENNQGLLVRCSHDGYTSKFSGLKHQRQWCFSGNTLEVIDRIYCNQKISANLNYYLHPSLTCKDKIGNNEIKLDIKGKELQVMFSHEAEISQAHYYSGFGLKEPNICLRVPFLDSTKVLFIWGE